MKLGIISDIHDHAEHLRSAVKTFNDHEVDRVVLLGDVIETGEHVVEIIRMLRALNAVGVWGNHDLGLCHDPRPRVTSRFDTTTLNFFASLSSRLELGDMLLSHGLPTWDPTDPTIYYLADKPWEPGTLSTVFSACPQRIFLTGHYHRWFAATEDGVQGWDGQQALVLDTSQRYFICVHAVQNGWCAVLDTAENVFTPIFLGEPAKPMPRSDGRQRIDP